MAERKLLKAAITLLLVAYPVVVYFGLQQYSPRILVLILLGAAVLRWFFWRDEEMRHYLLIIAVALALLTVLSGSAYGLLFYPVAMNLGFLAVFLLSLKTPPTIVERIARRMEGELSLAAIAYTRSATKAWCVFFALNASIALITVFASAQAWALYNGLIAYGLIGAMMAGEYLVRQRYKARHGE